MTDQKDNIHIFLIAAVAENNVIGANGDMCWKIKSELQYFKKTTVGYPVIHGRKSFESLGAPLPGRANIVITRDQNYAADGITVVHTLDDAIRLAKEIATKEGKDGVFIAGGAEIYRATLPMAEKLYLTEVHMAPAGETLFPAFDRSLWRETKREFHAAQQGESADYTITVLERIQDASGTTPSACSVA